MEATREELEQLLADEEKENLGNNQAIKRLLAESLPDLHLLILAFVALLCAAGADLFEPLFVGKIISNVIITRDSHQFIQNVFIIAIIRYNSTKVILETDFQQFSIRSGDGTQGRNIQCYHGQNGTSNSNKTIQVQFN